MKSMRVAAEFEITNVLLSVLTCLLSIYSTHKQTVLGIGSNQGFKWKWQQCITAIKVLFVCHFYRRENNKNHL